MSVPEGDHTSTRRSTGNPRVDSGESRTIRGTNQTALIVVDRFVKRTAGDMYCPKLRYWKKTAGRYNVGFPAEFTLSHDEAVQLQRILAAGIAIAEGREVGDYVTLRVNDVELLEAARRDPTAVAGAIIPILMSDGVLASLAAFPDTASLMAGLEAAARVAELEAGARELQQMLDGGVVQEQAYQDWCERHWWAFGPVYIARDDVRVIAIGDSVDVLMERTANGLRDIFELKRPDMKVLNYDRDHRSYYWSSETSKALGQCHRYLDALHEGAARGLRDNPHVVAYHPRARLIIGRSLEWTEEERSQLHGLNSRLHGLSVLTYDDLLMQAQQMIDLLRLRAG